jgi:hypothetical protein
MTRIGQPIYFTNMSLTNDKLKFSHMKIQETNEVQETTQLQVIINSNKHKLISNEEQK